MVFFHSVSDTRGKWPIMSQLMSSIKAGLFLQRKFGAAGDSFLALSFHVLDAMTGLIVKIKIGTAKILVYVT